MPNLASQTIKTENKNNMAGLNKEADFIEITTKPLILINSNKINIIIT